MSTNSRMWPILFQIDDLQFGKLYETKEVRRGVRKNSAFNYGYYGVVKTNNDELCEIHCHFCCVAFLIGAYYYRYYVCVNRDNTSVTVSK